MQDEKAKKVVLHHMDQFERQIIPPSEFCWKYFEDLVDKNRSTLWRDMEIRKRYNNLKSFLHTIGAASDTLTPLQKKRATDQQRIRKLEARVCELQSMLETAQERQLEMQAVLMDRGIDPTFVLQKRFRKHPHE